MNKRESCRAIIFKDNKIILMYRKKENRIYYTFIGGGRNENESLDDCIRREVFEELGINVEPLKEVYYYENEKTKQHFYLCNWTDGEFATGVGEEFDRLNDQNFYEPQMIEIDKIHEVPLMPNLVASALIDDLKTYGKNLSNELKNIYE